VSNPKVFEFAKEIGLTPLALMDKIRDWHLPVKSHMAELDPDLLQTIKNKLEEEKRPASRDKKEAKKTTTEAVKKKATPAATAKKAAAATAPSAAPAASAPAKAPVVRRKAKALDAETKDLESAQDFSAEAEPAARESFVDTPIESQAEAAGKAKVDTMGEPSKEVPQAPKGSIEKSSPTLNLEATVSVVAPAPSPSSGSASPTPSVVSEKSGSAQGSAQTLTPPASVTSQNMTGSASAANEEAIKKPVMARKKEVSIGHSGITSESQPAQAAPKRNIVGRMDLSRVTPPPGAGPRTYGGPGARSGGPRPPGSAASGGGVGGAGASGFRGPQTSGFLGRSKGNLRAGFIQSPMPTEPGRFDDEEQARKREEKRRMKGGPTEGGNARELEEQPPTFDSAEFRKREMVFQPKKKKGSLNRPAMQTQVTTPAAHKRVVKVNGTMKVSDLAVEIGAKSAELIKILMKNGVMATVNTDLDFDTIALIIPDFGYEAANVKKTAEDVILETAFGDLQAEPVSRPPVVTVMGHVDHGKTSLLDAIRSAKVAAGEAGGITQHIGAYQVTLDDGYKITFLDTPGHEAFTHMRARGANVTDIAVIVVAADDGVMPQTAEAINHAKAANVPMIVAVNKMDKPGANPDRVKQQLTEFEVVPEEWGGQTIFVNVSALKKTGISELLEQIKLLAEMGELKANPQRSGTGVVIEAKLEKGRGSVATLLVQNGTVSIGQYIVAGSVKGRVRSIMNDKGERIDKALPGMPVEILGLDGVPSAGDKFDVVKDEAAAEEVSHIRLMQIENEKQKSKKVSLEEIFAKVQQGDVKELAIILKTDVAGSLEALQGMFSKLDTKEVKIKILHAAIGGITESDVLLASTAKGLIIGFNVRPDSGAIQASKQHNIEIRTYSIVYELIDDMKKAMSGLLAPTIVEKVLGRAEVRNTFSVPKIGLIAGCFVADGKIQRSSMARLIRDGKIVFEGKIGSLKRFKDDAREVATGFECGIGIENFNDVKVGDIIEAFVKEEVARELHPVSQAEAR
jgi:translation initiation factor IF-2